MCLLRGTSHTTLCGLSVTKRSLFLYERGRQDTNQVVDQPLETNKETQATCWPSPWSPRGGGQVLLLVWIALPQGREAFSLDSLITRRGGHDKRDFCSSIEHPKGPRATDAQLTNPSASIFFPLKGDLGKKNFVQDPSHREGHPDNTNLTHGLELTCAHYCYPDLFSLSSQARCVAVVFEVPRSRRDSMDPQSHMAIVEPHCRP